MKISTIRALAFSAVLVSASTMLAQGPAWDSSGNGLLNGSYNFRQVYYQTSDAAGNLGGGLALFGTISFDGNGHYSVSNATLVTRTATGTNSTNVNTTGTYSVAVNGHGFLSGLYCPVSAGCPDNNLYVLVSNGLVAGSSTENNLNDVFIAGQATSSQSSSPFQGTWTLAGYLPSIGNSAGYSADVFFNVTPDGNGNLGNVSVAGYYGAVNLNFPAVTGGTFFYSGGETLYFSPDGTFCFGGSPVSTDLLIGVRNPDAGTSQTLSGIYYGAGIDENEYFLTKGAAAFETHYGAFNASGGKIVEADRTQDSVRGVTFTNTISSTYPTAINGTYTSVGQTQYAVNGSGSVRIGAGIGPFLSISVAFKGPTFSGTGVYLNPMGVSNAASFAPFTAGISPGEYIVLYGSGLAAVTDSAKTLPLPTQLDGVQVMINGTAAPLFYVSPGQISAIVPSVTTTAVAQIQVINNGTPSNTVTQFVRKTSPGLFTNPPDGVSLGAVEHADGSLVNESSPARPGETIQAFLTGLGPVSPAVPDGQAAPTTTLSRTTNQFTAFIGWANSTVTFSGLVPTLAGLYQVNVLVPAVVPTGDQIFEIDGPDSNSTQGIIPVLSSTTQQLPPAAEAGKARLAVRR